MIRTLLKLVFVLAMAIGSAAADELLLYPQADSASSNSSGRASLLQVDKSSGAFFSFNNSLEMWSLEGLTLEVYVRVSRGGVAEIRLAGGSLSETARRRPVIKRISLAKKRVGTKSSKISFSLPAPIWSNTPLILALTTSGSAKFSVYSRESKKQPVLKVRYTPLPTPTRSATATATSVPFTPAATATPTLAPTAVATATFTPVLTPTANATGTATLTPIATSTPTSTATATATATPTPTVVSQTILRGPYLQKAGPQRMIIRWRTAESSIGAVRYGTSVASLTTSRFEGGATTDHRIEITDFSPDTRYYYTLGTTTGPAQYASESQSFVTAPVVGTRKPARIWVLGDSGTGDAAARAVRDAYINHTGATSADVWLMLGDNALPNGSDAQHQTGIFDVFPAFLKSVPLWPCIGNHDSETAGPPYFSIFSLPQNAESGGTASGTEKYYSFDYANIHFVVLDSTLSDRSAATAVAPAGNMARWLINDLAATTQEWIIAYWHHPPYTNGSHNSDSEATLIQMRENILPYLEDGGVDLVLGGHSHAYERSYFIDGYYGNMASFAANRALYVKQEGLGRVDNGGAYTKQLGAKNAGAVFAVVGSSGRLSGGTLEHPAMVQLSESPPTRGLVENGSLIVDVNGLTLDAKFLNKDGVVKDYFRIEKQ